MTTIVEAKREARIAKKRALVLTELAWAAQIADRCPTNAELEKRLGSVPFEATPSELARQGYCVVYLYGKCYRVVEIDGHRTAPPPAHYGEPYKVIRKIVP